MLPDAPHLLACVLVDLAKGSLPKQGALDITLHVSFVVYCCKAAMSSHMHSV